jgi:hypothetical protein
MLMAVVYFVADDVATKSVINRLPCAYQAVTW